MHRSEQRLINVKPFCFIIAIATSHPCPWKWELHHGIVPLEEDYFDYLPISAALWPALHGLREFITLSAEDVSSFRFDDFKVKKSVHKLFLQTLQFQHAHFSYAFLLFVINALDKLGIMTL